MKEYEVEIRAKLKVFAFSPSDASDAVDEAIREAESIGAVVKDLSFDSIKEIS
jgi:hypothetical protein